MDRTTAVFDGTLRGDSLAGTFREGTSEGRFAYARIPAATALFEERAVTFSNGAVTLAGSLLLPPQGASLAAVVFVHGSGAEGRWASRFLAGQLASRGIAALIFDKRGVGGSSGDWRTATLEDLAADAAAAVARHHGQPRELLDSLAVSLRGRPWFFAPPPANAGYWSFSKVFGAYRPLDWWARIRVPVLLLYGAADQRVPSEESAARIAATLIRSGSKPLSTF